MRGMSGESEKKKKKRKRKKEEMRRERGERRDNGSAKGLRDQRRNTESTKRL